MIFCVVDDEIKKSSIVCKARNTLPCYVLEVIAAKMHA